MKVRFDLEVVATPENSHGSLTFMKEMELDFFPTKGTFFYLLEEWYMSFEVKYVGVFIDKKSRCEFVGNALIYVTFQTFAWDKTDDADDWEYFKKELLNDGWVIS
jgi:hypothetical protein